MQTRFALHEVIEQVVQKSKSVRRGAHKNQSMAELPSAFLVSSHPISSATGSNEIDAAPMAIKIANIPPVSLGLTVGTGHPKEEKV